MKFKNLFWGIMLIVVGALFLIEELAGIDFGHYLWPIVLIVSGVLLLVRNQFGSDFS